MLQGEDAQPDEGRTENGSSPCAGSWRCTRRGDRSRPTALERATRRLAHRGPDGQRTWISDDGRVGLGHARLSIIDLATGDQPIASEDEAPADRRQRRVLRLRAHPARPRGPGPPPPHPLRQRDRPAPLRGPRHGLPARSCAASSPSPSGTAPTTRSSPPATASASSRSSTRSTAVRCTWPPRSRRCFAAGVPARWDRDAFFQANHFLVAPQDRTLFDGIYQVPPGHYLLATGGAGPADPLLGLRLPGGRRRPADRPRRRVRRAVPARPGRGGPPAPAGRRAGRLLPQRRDRLLRRAGPGGGAPRRPDPGLHADLRPGRATTRGPSPARWRRTPGPTSTRSRSASPTSPTTSPMRPGRPRRSASTRTAWRSTC